jgi:hypothetical protein
MAFQPAPDTVQAEVRFDFEGRQFENTLNFYKAGGYTQSDIEELAGEVGDAFVTGILPLLSTAVTYRETHVRGLSSSTDLEATDTDNAGLTGTQTSPMVINAAKAFTLDGGLTGRNARGRIFIGGLSGVNMSDNNHVTQAWVDDIIDALLALKDVIEALGWLWVTVSRVVAGVRRTTAVNYPVTLVKVSNLTTDSMRGRLPKT